MGTKPKQTEQDILADARHLLERATARLSEFLAASKGRKTPYLDKAFLAGMRQQIDDVEKAIGGQVSKQSAVEAATESEVEARTAVAEALVDIRDDIKLEHGRASAMARAFGVGARISDRQTASLLKAADTIIGSFKDHKAEAIDAGVTAARIAEVQKLRNRLAAADTTQRSHQSTKRGDTLTKAAAVARLKKTNTRVRAVATRVFRHNAKVLAEFRSTAPRRTPKKKPVPPKTPA